MEPRSKRSSKRIKIDIDGENNLVSWKDLPLDMWVAISLFFHPLECVILLQLCQYLQIYLKPRLVKRKLLMKNLCHVLEHIYGIPPEQLANALIKDHAVIGGSFLLACMYYSTRIALPFTPGDIDIYIQKSDEHKIESTNLFQLLNPEQYKKYQQDKSYHGNDNDDDPLHLTFDDGKTERLEWMPDYHHRDVKTMAPIECVGSWTYFPKHGTSIKIQVIVSTCPAIEFVNAKYDFSCVTNSWDGHTLNVSDVHSINNKELSLTSYFLKERWVQLNDSGMSHFQKRIEKYVSRGFNPSASLTKLIFDGWMNHSYYFSTSKEREYGKSKRLSH